MPTRRVNGRFRDDQARQESRTTMRTAFELVVDLDVLALLEVRRPHTSMTKRPTCLLHDATHGLYHV